MISVANNYSRGKIISFSCDAPRLKQRKYKESEKICNGPLAVIEDIKNPESSGSLRSRAQRNFVVFHARVVPHLLDFLTLSGMASCLTRKV